jgi:hypothetical protein
VREANNARLHETAAQYVLESDRLFPDAAPQPEHLAV